MTDKPRANSLSLARILERVPRLTEEIKQGAAERDLSGELPYWAFKLVRQSGILALRVPTELGGPGGTITDVIETLATLAAGDSNVPHSLRTHFNFSESFLLDENSPQREEHARLLLAGVLFGGAGAEIGTPRPSNVTTSTLRKAPDGTYRLNGKKYYTTGTAFADIVLSSALTETGETVRISLPIERLGIDVRNDWDGMGQRLTASGGVFFNDVEVKEGEFFPTVKSARSELVFRHASTLRQLILMACQAGSVRNALAEAVDYGKNYARPITHGHSDTARGDYFIQREVGRIASLSFAIDTLITSSAKVLDSGASAVLSNHPELDRIITENAITVAKAQIALFPLALEAAERIFNVGGASATSRQRNFDRHWRNIRTIMSHNPFSYKEKAVGDYLLNGELPPTDGGFF
jgi:alkylation response protein AidB-like acyl-CoA dehydrogenase